MWWPMWLFVLSQMGRWFVWLVAALMIIPIAFIRFRTSGDVHEQTYYIQPIERILGDAEQDAALEGLQKAAATRVEQMAQAMDHLLIEVPNSEQPSETSKMRSVIRLQSSRGGVGGLGGLPVDHFFMEWLPSLDEEERGNAKLHIRADAGPPPMVGRRISVHTKIMKHSQTDKVVLTVRVGISPSCEQELVLSGGENEKKGSLRLRLKMRLQRALLFIT